MSGAPLSILFSRTVGIFVYSSRIFGAAECFNNATTTSKQWWLGAPLSHNLWLVSRLIRGDEAADR